MQCALHTTAGRLWQPGFPIALICSVKKPTFGPRRRSSWWRACCVPTIGSF